MDNAANGTNISLVQGDTRLIPAQATTVTDQFISNPNVVAVVGPAGSLEVRAVGPLFGHAGMAFISGSATNSVLTSGPNATFFRVVPNDRLQGPDDARFIIGKLHPRAVLLVDDRESYSTGLAAAMIPLLRRAGIRVDHESVSQSQTNFSRLVRKVTASTGVVILPWQVASNAQKFGRALASRRSRAVIFGTDGLFAPGVFTITGSYVSAFGPDITAIPGDSSIAQAARSRFGSFGMFGPPAYAATDVIAQAIAAVCRAGQQPTRATVLAQIRNTNEPTSILGEPIRFTPNGELKVAHWFVFKVGRAGRYRMLQ
jgi:branched-chain amino acid transport system substrate-binding protein